MASPTDELQITLAQNHQAPKLFSNFASIIATPEEFIIFFGERNQENDAKADELARVYVTPAHAKRLALVLLRTVKNYEDTFGTIVTDNAARLTPEARKRLTVEEEEGNA
jgi:hypothetical protein